MQVLRRPWVIGTAAVGVCAFLVVSEAPFDGDEVDQHAAVIKASEALVYSHLPTAHQVDPYSRKAQRTEDGMWIGSGSVVNRTTGETAGSYSVTFVQRENTWHPASIVLLGEVLFEHPDPSHLAAELRLLPEEASQPAQ